VRRRSAQALLLAATLALCALLAESVVRYVFRAAPQLHVDIYRMDSGGRLLLRPNLVRRQVSPHWDVEIRTNAQGRRDHEDARDSGDAAVILGLGDSQAFGWGVPLEDSFYSIAERESGLRIVKAAVPGTGPWDYVEMLQLVGAELRPRLVVASIFVGNDFTDAAYGQASERLAVDRGLLIRRGASSWRDVLARRSHLVQVLRAWQFNRARSNGAGTGRGRIWDDAMREYAEIHLAQDVDRSARAYAETERALDALHASCNRLGARLLVLAVPRSWQIDEAEAAEMRRGLGYAESDLEMLRPQRFLAEWGARQNVRVLTPTPDADGMFFSPDAHLTPAGHRAVAEVLTPALAQNATIEPGP